MENKSDKCYNCKYFDRYYTKGIKKFDRTEFGWCCKKIQTIKSDEACGSFIFKSKNKRSRILLELCLNDLLTQITEIRNVLEEDADDGKEL